MQQQFFEQMQSLNEKVSGSFSKLSQLIFTATDELIKHNTSTTHKLMNLGVQHAQNISKINKTEEAMSLQINFLNEWNTICNSHARNLFDMTQNLSSEFNKLFQENLKSFSEGNLQK